MSAGIYIILDDSLFFTVKPSLHYNADIATTLPVATPHTLLLTKRIKANKRKIYPQSSLSFITNHPLVQNNTVIPFHTLMIIILLQTGSGKTYAITGSSSEYDERGIIPRSIQHVFEFTNAVSVKHFCSAMLPCY